MLEDNDGQQQHTEQCKKKYYPRIRKKIESRSEYFEEDLVVISAQVRIPSRTYDMLNQFILQHFDPAEDMVPIQNVINYVFNEWAQKVTTDYKEFGKLLLNPVRQANGLPEVEI